MLASGGSRGDFVVSDPTDGSLLVTQSDRILRIRASNGGSFGGVTFTLSETSADVPATGGNGAISITASSPAAAWIATSNVAWIQIVDGTGGNGNGTVSYVVDANPTTATRTGTLTIGGNTFTVTQAGIEPAIVSGLNTYVFSGQRQNIDIPANSAPTFSTFVARVTLDESLFLLRQPCPADSGENPIQSSFKLAANSLVIHLTDHDGIRRTVTYPGRDAGAIADGAVLSTCKNGRVGKTTLFWNLRQAGYLSLVFDDEAPNPPAFSAPFTGAFLSPLSIKKGIFAYDGVDEDGPAASGLTHSAYVTCFVRVASPTSDPFTSPCGSPAPPVLRPSTLHTYAFSGIDNKVVKGAKIYGKFTLDESRILSPQNCDNATVWTGPHHRELSFSGHR